MRRLGDILAAPGRSFGTWSQIDAPEVIDMLGSAGFSFVVIDCQHGPFGIETAERMARAATANRLAAAIRVSRLDEVEILKALDAGMSHVIVPDVSSANMAARAVDATRFAPHGSRGACPCVRSGDHFVADWHDYAAAEEARTGIVALVESVEGISAVGEIARTPGLAALMAGPFDLSVSMGLNGNWRDTRVTDALRHLVGAARDSGIPAIMPVFSPDRSECRDLVEIWSSEGVSCFMIGSDKILISNAFREWTTSVRAFDV
ncbi:hypothetical protein HKCCE3408_08335 [Rhodobacterales bacterium HKCCE3408]|nr:hypothetical protein [Rhodobacterales bacterium HKCCE3408]